MVWWWKVNWVSSLFDLNCKLFGFFMTMKTRERKSILENSTSIVNTHWIIELDYWKYFIRNFHWYSSSSHKTLFFFASIWFKFIIIPPNLTINTRVSTQSTDGTKVRRAKKNVNFSVGCVRCLYLTDTWWLFERFVAVLLTEEEKKIKFFRSISSYSPRHRFWILANCSSLVM